MLARPADEVAPLLLGATLTGRGVTVRLTEVEAYLGQRDPGSHAFRGVTPRTRTMFGEPGHLYVYFSYGMHVCANIVCSPAGEASAVLLRAGEVVDGLDLARERRPTARVDAELARGPARLTRALGIALDDDTAPLDGAPFALEPASASVLSVSGPRVGVSGPGGTDAFPLRFWIPGDPTVSVYRRSPRG
ncbi:DNA-3-methyladenine glycosylase [Protaetiibacter intestinalis]|uniref:Putative 3-methyladenine DNA glycosylase n=1 Tax=Protaetiibacter intestinalis TaxID=2419774 RepID=A0A387BLF5_9MICO|nr:DNA-3-methyladenine glycosylase [Protaetiibacter intestinalis]AYF99340.1 DNA-3-methyladenine glycosylase [Protaetiibacter intestinalis]